MPAKASLRVILFLAVLLLSATTLYATSWDAAGDYLAGWQAGQNPNGAWSYGWSTTPGSGLTLYTVNANNVGGYPQFDSWNDPNNFIYYTPVIYLNTGGEVNDNQLHHLPAGALVIHGGGTAASCGVDGACFSETIWTAPTSGLFDLSATFTGRQYTMNGLVEIILTSNGNSTTLLSGTVLDQTSQSLAQEISLSAGDTLTFAAKSNVGLAADTTQLDAMITAVPEPSTLALLGSGSLAGIGVLRRKLAR